MVEQRRVSSYFTHPDKCPVSHVNNHGEFGRWKFLETEDPCDVANVIRGEVIVGFLERI